jgi:hypothetical protein
MTNVLADTTIPQQDADEQPDVEPSLNNKDEEQQAAVNASNNPKQPDFRVVIH